MQFIDHLLSVAVRSVDDGGQFSVRTSIFQVFDVLSNIRHFPVEFRRNLTKLANFLFKTLQRDPPFAVKRVLVVLVGSAQTEAHISLVVQVSEPLEVSVKSFGQRELPARDR